MDPGLEYVRELEKTLYREAQRHKIIWSESFCHNERDSSIYLYIATLSLPLWLPWRRDPQCLRPGSSWTSATSCRPPPTPTRSASCPLRPIKNNFCLFSFYNLSNSPLKAMLGIFLLSVSMSMAEFRRHKTPSIIARAPRSNRRSVLLLSYTDIHTWIYTYGDVRLKILKGSKKQINETNIQGVL